MSGFFIETETDLYFQSNPSEPNAKDKMVPEILLEPFSQEISEDADQAERLSQGVWDADSCSKRPMRSSN